jgi:predicted Zn finger-like uncharacterized protein
MGDNAAHGRGVMPMNVFCSHCSTGYLLPDDLLGPRGARVRCPTCGKTFVVLLETAPAEGGEGAPETIVEEPATPASPESRPPESDAVTTTGADRTRPGDEGLARELLDALADQAGPRLDSARSRGRVLAEFGPELMTVYEEFRRRVGVKGSAVAFRRALKERWGVDLLMASETL